MISWGSAANTTSSTDISTNGTLLVAHNGGPSNTTVNTVPFTAADLLAGQPTGMGLLNNGTTGNASFNTLPEEVDFGGGPGLMIIELASFTPGNTIEIQVFLQING